MIEIAPHIPDIEIIESAYDKSSKANQELSQLIDKINYEYEYWIV